MDKLSSNLQLRYYFFKETIAYVLVKDPGLFHKILIYNATIILHQNSSNDYTAYVA